MGDRGHHRWNLALAMRTFVTGFIAGGVCLYVLPTALAVWLQERNLRRTP